MTAPYRPELPPAPPPPLSFTRPVLTAADLKAAVLYTLWLAAEFEETAPPQSAPAGFGVLLHAAAAAVLNGVSRGNDDAVFGLLSAIADWTQTPAARAAAGGPTLLTLEPNP